MMIMIKKIFGLTSNCLKVIGQLAVMLVFLLVVVSVRGESNTQNLQKSSDAFEAVINSKKVDSDNDFQKEYRSFVLDHLKRVKTGLPSQFEQFGKTEKAEGLEIPGKPYAIIFVSLGMPDASLKRIIRDADFYNIPVVIRGLYKNSFKETTTKVLRLVEETNKGGVVINPNWFREHQVTVVPTLVLGKDKIAGNITIQSALELIAASGEEVELAKHMIRGNT